MKDGSKKVINFLLNRWKIIIPIIMAVCVGIILIKGFTNTLALEVESMPDSMTSGMGTNDERVNLFPTLTGDERIALVPFYATDSQNNKYIVYCLEKEKGWGENVTLTKGSGKLDNGYVYIMQNGYPAKAMTGNAANDEYLTRVALWLYQDRLAGVADTANGVLTANQKTVIKGTSYYTHINKLVTEALEAAATAVTPNPTFSVGTSSFTLSSDGTYLETGLITVNSNVGFETYQVSLNNSSAKVLNESNVEVSTLNSGQKFKIRIPVSSITSSTEKIRINVITNYIEHEVYSYFPSDDRIQSVVASAIVPVNKQKAVNNEVSLPTGSLIIEKQDSETNAQVAGAEITIKRAATNEVVGTFTSTTAAYTINNLILGNYIIEEAKAPSGYVKLSDSTTKKVSGNNETAILKNKKIDVKIIKKDEETGQPVAGADLQILDSTNTQVYRFTSTTTAQSIPNLALGTYTVKELNPPSGYVTGTNKTFTITESTTQITVEFMNKKTSLKLGKLDAASSDYLVGATLQLKRLSDNQIIDTWVTTSGQKEFRGLVNGNYEVCEISPPEGYVPTTACTTLTIPTTTSTNLYNSKNKLTITKIDGKTSAILSGATLLLTDSSGTKVKEFVTGSTPTVIEKIKAGTYYLEETKAPEGYALNKEKKKIEIKETDENIQVSFSNYENAVALAKVDKDTNAYVAGASMRLVDSSDKVIETWISGTTAHVIEGLKVGTYYLEETEAPVGYILNTKRVKVDITTSNEIITYTMKNTKTKLTINKKDADTNQLLAGVIMQLLDKDKNILMSWTTTAAPYEITDIGEGTYYVKEVKTIDGYVLDDIEKKIVIDQNNPEVVVDFKNQMIKVDLEKVDAKTGKNIPGATLKLTGEDQSFQPVTWVSTEKSYRIERIKPGTYYLEEVNAPPGYIKSNSKISFKVLNTGKIQRISISSDHILIKILNKQLIVDTNQTEGYKFLLERTDGTKIEEWTSTKTAYTTKTLDLGDYKLTEVDVPDGIIKNESPYFFTVGQTDELSEVRLSNDFTKMNISKLDITNGEEVEGASLTITNEKGEVVDQWMSKKETHYIERLPVGKYTLTEILEPNGYVLNTSTVVFEVLETGDIQATEMFNTPIINTPNTGVTVPLYVYIIGVILIVCGSSILILNVIRNEAK